MTCYFKKEAFYDKIVYNFVGGLSFVLVCELPEKGDTQCHHNKMRNR